MLTLEQWNAMSDQQKWDYVHALDDMIDAIELELDHFMWGDPDTGDEDTRELEAVQLDWAYSSDCDFVEPPVELG